MPYQNNRRSTTYGPLTRYNPYPSPSSSMSGRRLGQSFARTLGRAATSRWGERIIRSIPVVGSVYEGARLAGDIYNGARSLFSRGTQTRRNRTSAMATQSGPTIKKAYGRAIGTYKGRFTGKKPPKMKLKRQSQKHGFSIHFERGGTVTDPYCAYVGHGTCPQQQMRRLMLGAMLKLVLNRLNIHFQTVDQPLTHLTSGDQIVLILKINTNTANQGSITVTLAANQPSFTALLNLFVQQWILFVQANTLQSGEQFVINEIRFNALGSGDLTSVKIPLENAKIVFECHSELKVQNRSVPAEGDDTTDEVDRIPVKGYMYTFKGSGGKFRRSAAAALGEINFEPVHNVTDGLFTYSAGAAGGAAALREPPLPINFSRLIRYGSAYVEPGSIKKSVLKVVKTMYLQTLVNRVVGFDESGAKPSQQLHETGEFAMLALEKLIETSNSETTQLVTLAYEVDTKIFGYIKPGNVSSTIGEHYYGTVPS